MYCLEKLQRELAYFFDMDLRELPRVQDLLKQKGYTQIQKGDEIITLESSTPTPQETPKVDSTLPYTDTQGHTHQIPTDIAQKWLESFGLKDLQESYAPKFSEQVAQALEPILQGEQINLSANSLVKLIQRDRAEFLPYIKETLETPNAVVRQVDGAIIFAKDYRDEKLGKFFASVSKNDQGEWVISSNAPKNLNNLQNKIKEGGEVLYSDLPELPIIAKPDLTAKALNSEASQGDIIPQAAREKPKWSKADQKAWKTAKLAETRAKAQELQAKLQPIYDEVRPLVIQARKLEKPYKEKGKKLPPKVEKQVNKLLAKVSESITPKQKPFEAELEKHGLQLNRTDFLHYPESGSIQVTPKQNSNLKWKNKERGEQGLKGSAKYREQALEKLSEKSYIDRLEPATKAQNPLTQLHGLKYEILKDLYKAKRYATQGGASYETYARYASRASDELDIIEQAIRELKNAIVPKPQRAELVRSKVQDFIKWRDEVRFDVDYLLGLESDGAKHALEYLRDLPTPTKHHASFVKDLQEQIHKHFDTDPTPPTPPRETPKADSTQNTQSVATPQAEAVEMRNRGFQGAGEGIYLGDNEQARAVESTIYRSNATPQTQAREIPEQDLPHHAEKQLYKELESLKPLKRELTQLRESGEWRSKQGRARRKELDEKIKEAEARGITSTQIQTANAKNYEKFLSKYGDMEYFKELAQESRDRYIQGLQKDIDNYDASKTTPTPNGIIFTKQSLENILESTRGQELDIAGQIWEIAHSMAKLREGAIYKQTDEKIGEFYTKERGKIQKALGIKPIAEFGENYTEYYRDGAGAIEKLLAEKKGQVAGAFYRKELGDIDLVWGEVEGSGQQTKGWGLAKIIEKHGDEFEDIAKELDEIIRDGEVVKRAGRDEAYNIEYNGFKVGINKGFNKQGENKWIVTAFDDSVEKTAKTAPASDSTKETDLSLNSSDIVAQDLLETPKVDSNAILQSAMKKFAYDEKKAKDLLEWHKDSSPLTKDENGLPKVFYHYTHTGISHTNGAKRDVNFEAFVRRTTLKDKYDAFNKYDKGSQVHNFGSRWGIFFTENDDYAKRYGELVSKTDLDVETLIERKEAKAYKVFLNIKNPFNLDTIITKENAQEFYELFKVKNPTKRMREININDYLGKEVGDYVIDLGYTEYITKFENEVLYKKDANGAHFGQRDVLNLADHLSLKGYDGLILSKRHFIQNKPIFRLEFVVFNPNQIKHIENRGVESESGRKYFNESSPNIFHSNPHAGAGLLGGSVAGIEQDENGQWRFSPEKFALGLLGGVAGSKAVAKGLEWRARKVAKSYPNIAKDNPQLMQEIAKRDLHTYATASTHNTLTRFLNNNKLFDINPQLFAGEKALANEAYAPHKARLERAKELEAKGAKEIEIWEQTGWYKDKDQRWKFEISQRGGELRTKDEFGRPYKRAFLSKILQDDELFNAYPKLKNMRVIEDKKLGRGVNASYDPKLKDIYIKNLQAKEAKISLYHELQHAIQDIEGFAYGFKDYVTSDENFHKYAIQHGEVEARNVESRMNLPTKKDVQTLKRAAKNIDKHIENLKTSDYEEWYKNERINTEQSKKKDFLALAQATQEVINQGKYTDHPHETMDTPLKDTIAEATMHGEALSKKLGDKAGDTLKSTPKAQGELKEIQQQLQSTIQTHLENLPPNPTPQPINEAKIKALIKRFDNIENLQEHLNTRADTKARQEIFSLLDDTLQTPQVHYKKDGKDKYLKRYKSERKEPYFYLLVTKDENKTFITHFKTRDSRYLSKEIAKAQEIMQGADIIEALSQRTGDI